MPPACKGEAQSDRGKASRVLQVHLPEPVVCRSAGLPFDRLEAFAGALDRQALWDLLDDESFVDALATMHPAALDSLRSRRKQFRPDRRPSDMRRAELTLYRYLVRFASRNDTTGTAGFTLWGAWGRSIANSARRVIWPSPRHLELLCHRAAHGPLRQQARRVLFPRFQMEGSLLLDTHTGDMLEQGADCWTLRLGESAEDPWACLLGRVPGSPWEEPIGRLESLRAELEKLSGWDFAAKMAEADRIAAGLAPCRSLNAPHYLRRLVHLALDDPALVLDRVADFPPRPLSEREEELLARCPVHSCALGPLRAEMIELLEEGRLTLRGAEYGSLGFRPGWPWREHFEEWSRQLAHSPLAPDLLRRARLLRAAAPAEPPRANPLAAEAELLEESWQDAVSASDRNFFLCDSSRDAQFDLPEILRDRLLQQLPAWFRLAGWQEYCRERLQRPWLARVAQPSPREGPRSLSRFLADFADSSALPGAVRAQMAFARQEIDYLDEQQWKVVAGPGYVRLQETPGSEEFESWLGSRRLVTTMDLMPGQDGTLVVSEAHCGAEGLGLTTFFPHIHPDGLTPEAGRDIFGRYGLFLQPASPSKQSVGILAHLHDAALAVQNPHSWCPQTRVIPIGRLRMHIDSGRVRVVDDESVYRLLTPQLTLGNLRTVGYSASSLAASVAAKLGGEAAGLVQSCPEIRLGDLILVRRSLHLPAALAVQALAQDPRGTFLRTALDLPRFVFMQTRWKPMLFDFESRISMEVLAAELTRTDRVSFSPMQPHNEQLWLQLEDRGHTSELRFAAYAQGSDFTDDEEGCWQSL